MWLELRLPFVHMWTYGESNPDLVHAMDAFYRYTIGPFELSSYQNSFSNLLIHPEILKSFFVVVFM